jgi:hypothetical protein
MITNPRRHRIPTDVDGAAESGVGEKLPDACAAMDSADGDGRLANVPKLLDRVVCRYSSHDWWALAYPPARRWECRRCGAIVEEAPSSVPDRRRVRREPTKRAKGTSPS